MLTSKTARHLRDRHFMDPVFIIRRVESTDHDQGREGPAHGCPGTDPSSRWKQHVQRQNSSSWPGGHRPPTIIAGVIQVRASICGKKNGATLTC